MADVKLILLVNVDVARDLGGWTPGSFEHNYEDPDGRAVRTDGDARATNFPSVLAPYLFGNENGRYLGGFHPRLHRRVDLQVSVDTLTKLGLEDMPIRGRVTYAELVRTLPRHADSSPGIMAVHLNLRLETLEDVVTLEYKLSRMRGTSAPDLMVRGALGLRFLRDCGLLADGVSATPESIGSDAEASIYPLVLFDDSDFQAVATAPQATPGSSSLRSEGEARGSASLRLYAVASAQSVQKMHTTAERLQAALDRKVSLSKSWSALVLRHGTAFQIHTEATDPYRQFIPVYFATIYADSMIFARLQELLVRYFEVEVNLAIGVNAVKRDTSEVHSPLRVLDRHLALAKARYLLKGVAASTGRALTMLDAYRVAVAFDDRLSTLDYQMTNLSRVAAFDHDAAVAEELKGLRESQDRSNRFIALVGVFAIPATLAIDTFGLLGFNPSAPNLAILVAVTAVSCVSIWGLLTARSRQTARCETTTSTPWAAEKTSKPDKDGGQFAGVD